MSQDMLGPLTRALVGVPARMLGLIMDIANRLGSTDAECFYNDLSQFVRSWKKQVAEKIAEVKVYLRFLSAFKLGATDGTDTYATAKEVFKAGFDADFENWGIVFSGVAPETNVASDELVLDGKFPDFLGKTAVELEKRRLLGSQFLKICREHPDKLRGGGYANFVVLTKNDEEVAKDLSNVFVAIVDVRDRDKLDASVGRFSDDRVWRGGGGPRVFHPQQ